VVRLKNQKYSVVQLTKMASIYADDQGKHVHAPAGYYVLTDQATGRVRVVSPTDYASMFETVSSVVRPTSQAYTAAQLTAQATVSVGSEGRIQRGMPGDWLVTNNTTGEAKIYKPADYIAAFE
jgi:hypothetical protein